MARSNNRWDNKVDFNILPQPTPEQVGQVVRVGAFGMTLGILGWAIRVVLAAP